MLRREDHFGNAASPDVLISKLARQPSSSSAPIPIAPSSISAKAERMKRGSVTRIPRLTRNSLSSAAAAAAAAKASASRMLLFPDPFSPMKTLTGASSRLRSTMDLKFLILSFATSAQMIVSASSREDTAVARHSGSPRSGSPWIARTGARIPRAG